MRTVHLVALGFIPEVMQPTLYRDVEFYCASLPPRRDYRLSTDFHRFGLPAPKCAGGIPLVHAEGNWRLLSDHSRYYASLLPGAWEVYAFGDMGDYSQRSTLNALSSACRMFGIPCQITMY